MPVKKAVLQHFRIDEEHSNSYSVWKKMGSPQSVTDEQFKLLEKAGQLQLLNPAQPMAIKDGEATITMVLPRHAVSLLRLDW